MYKKRNAQNDFVATLSYKERNEVMIITRKMVMAALLALALLAFINVCRVSAQEITTEPVQITDPVVIEALLNGDMSVLEEGEVRSAAETAIMGYSVRHHWGYPNNLQVYVNNTDQHLFTEFLIQVRQKDGALANRALTANMSPKSTYFERSGRETDPVALNVRMSNGGRTDSLHNAQACQSGPMVTMNRWTNGSTHPAISNIFVGQTIYYRFVGMPNWYSLPKDSYTAWSLAQKQGSLEIKLSPSDSAPLCLLLNWDWEYVEVPVKVNLPANSEWDPQSYRTIGVELKDVMDRKVTDFRFQIQYPSSFVTFAGLVMRDDLIGTWLVSSNEVIDQQTGMATLTVGGATQGAPITSDGLLVNLTFKRIANPMREASFILSETLLNAGAIYSEGSTGYVKIMPYRVQGTVYHVNGEAFPRVGTSLRGSQTLEYMETLGDGTFSLQSIETNSHVLDWGYDSVLSDLAINHSDATTTLRCSVGAEDCVLETMDVDGDGFVSPHDTYVLVQDLLGNTLPESKVGWFQCNPPRFNLFLRFSISNLNATCWLVGDANNSVLPMTAQAAAIESSPQVVFGQQEMINGNIVIPLIINQGQLDGATIDLALEGVVLIGTSAEEWAVADNGQRIIVYGQENADSITVNLTLKGEGKVIVSNLQTLDETRYVNVAEVTLEPLDEMPILQLELFLPMVIVNN